jgi:folate-binding protein YgfZ
MLAAKPGEVRSTVLTNAKGRIVDYLKVFVLEDRLLLMTSSGSSAFVEGWMGKFCITEEIIIKDVTIATTMYWLVGPKAISTASATFGIVLESRSVTLVPGFSGALLIAGDYDFHTPFAYIICSREDGSRVQGTLSNHAERIVPEAYEAFRISRGIFAFGSELSESFNPYEAGLIHALSFTKGQEVIARLGTYGKVKRRLAGLLFSSYDFTEEKTPELIVGSKVVGWRTSLSAYPMRNKYLGLGIVANDDVREGDTVWLASPGPRIEATVKDLPFLPEGEV